MALNIFKGIEQVTEATYTGLADSVKIGKLYLVKREDGYGDIYFGTRPYGHFSQKEINNLAQAIEDIKANKTAIAKNATDIEKQRTDFESLVSLVDSMVKYEYKEIESADVPEGVNPESKDAKPETVAKNDPEYITVGDKTYHKEAVSTSEVLASLEKMINDVDAKFADYKIKSVAEGDKVLSVDEQGVLSSTMSLKYDSVNHKITLYGSVENDAHKIGEVDTTDFIKDGMLETAELVTVTKTEDGKYVYGNGTAAPESVTAEGKYIRLHFNTDSNAKDIFLSVNELIDVYKGGKDITVNDDNTIDIALDEDITVMGVSVGTLANNAKLTKGMSLSEILKKMLIREIDVVATKPSVKISMTTPSVNSTYEVGSSVNVALSHTYTDGKFTGADSLYSYTSAAGCTEGDTTYKRGSNTITDGKETVTVEEATYTYTCTTSYGANTNTPKKNNGEDSSVAISADSCNSSNNVSFSGKFYGYIGYSEKTSAAEFDSDSIKALAATKTFLKVNETTTLVGTTAKTSNGTSIVIAVPNKYKLATINNGVGANILDNFSSDATVNYTVGTTNTSYHVYVYPITNGAQVEYKNVTITKA